MLALSMKIRKLSNFGDAWSASKFIGRATNSKMQKKDFKIYDYCLLYISLHSFNFIFMTGEELGLFYFNNIRLVNYIEDGKLVSQINCFILFRENENQKHSQHP